MTLERYYPMNEDSGDVIDYSGNEDHATPNQITYGVSGPLGESAFGFDGSSSYYDTTWSKVNNNFSVSVWIKTSTSGFGRVLSSRNGNKQNNTFLGHGGSNNERIRWHRVDDGWGTETTATSNTVVADGKWHFVVGMYNHNTGTMRVYVDGIEDGSDSNSPYNLSSPDHFTVGRDSDRDAAYYTGDASDVRIYNRVLSPLEVQYLYTVSQKGRMMTSKKKS